MFFTELEEGPFFFFVLSLPILYFFLLFVIPFIEGSGGCLLSLSFFLHFTALSFAQLLKSLLLLNLHLSEVFTLFVIQAIILLLDLCVERILLSWLFPESRLAVESCISTTKVVKTTQVAIKRLWLVSRFRRGPLVQRLVLDIWFFTLRSS